MTYELFGIRCVCATNFIKSYTKHNNQQTQLHTEIAINLYFNKKPFNYFDNRKFLVVELKCIYSNLEFTIRPGSLVYDCSLTSRDIQTIYSLRSSFIEIIFILALRKNKRWLLDMVYNVYCSIKITSKKLKILLNNLNENKSMKHIRLLRFAIRI